MARYPGWQREDRQDYGIMTTPLYTKLGNVFVLNGIDQIGDVVIISVHSIMLLLCIKADPENRECILEKFVDPTVCILDTCLDLSFGWPGRSRIDEIGKFCQVDISNYLCWWFDEDMHSINHIFKTIKDVYDKNARKSTHEVFC